jgi:hemolysin activation/secretion protein
MLTVPASRLDGIARLVALSSPLWLFAGAARAQDVRHFAIEEFRVEGNTQLPAEQIEDVVTPFLGPDRTTDDVEKARLALDALYTKRGFGTVATEIPEQDPTDGVILLHVTERRVGRLRVHGSRYFGLKEIRDQVPSLAEGKIPNINDVQREIVALNQWPDRRVTPVLRPGAVPGTVDVDLEVKDTLPVQASIELTNKRSVDTSALRTTASLGYSNLWQRGDAITVSYMMAPQHPKDTGILSAAYLLRLPDSSMSLAFSYLHSDSNVTTLGSTTVIGKGDVYGVRLQKTLGTDGPFSHSIAVGFDYKSFLDNTQDITGNSLTPVTYVPLTAQYQASWLNDANETLVNASVVLGTSGVGSNAVVLDQKRYLARSGFSYFRGDASRRDDLPWGLQSSLRITGQVSGDALISNEQFSVGGVDTVRGYLEAEALGDFGATMQAELRGPSYTDLAAGMIDEVRGFTFADAAGAGINNPLAEQKSAYRLASTGVGVRLRVLDHLSADLVGAHVLLTGPNSPAGGNRLLFRINGAF